MGSECSTTSVTSVTPKTTTLERESGAQRRVAAQPVLSVWGRSHCWMVFQFMEKGGKKKEKDQKARQNDASVCYPNFSFFPSFFSTFPVSNFLSWSRSCFLGRFMSGSFQALLRSVAVVPLQDSEIEDLQGFLPFQALWKIENAAALKANRYLERGWGTVVMHAIEEQPIVKPLRFDVFFHLPKCIAKASLMRPTVRRAPKRQDVPGERCCWKDSFCFALIFFCFYL